MQHVWQHGIEAELQGAQDGAWAWNGAFEERIQEWNLCMVVMQCVCGERTMKMAWLAAQLEMEEEEGKCPGCSKELIEGCCMECGEVYE